MSGEQTRRSAGRVQRYQNWASSVRGGSRLRRDTRGIGAAHATLFILGVLSFLVGIVLVVAFGGFVTLTPLWLLVLGLAAMFFGAAEIGVEAERRTR